MSVIRSVTSRALKGRREFSLKRFLKRFQKQGEYTFNLQLTDQICCSAEYCWMYVLLHPNFVSRMEMLLTERISFC